MGARLYMPFCWHLPQTWAGAGYFFDLADFLTWKASSSLARSQSTLTCKWTWLSHSKPGWQRDVGQQSDRDLKFVDAIMTTLRQKYSIDERRVYATGFSNGGLFTYLLLSARPNLFAAFALVFVEEVHARAHQLTDVCG